MAGFLWPGGYRACLCLTWDMDGESAFYFRNPEEARGQLSELVQRSYGPNVGVYKVLDLLDRYGLRATFYVPGYTARLHPEAVKEIVARGHPVGLHGYMHETMEKLGEEDERRMFRASIRAISQVSGRTPKLFRSPSFELNRRTPALLAEFGVASDSSLMGDDYPYLIDTPRGPIVELPVQWILDDFEFWGHTKSNRQKPIADPESVVRLWRSELDGLYEHGGIFVLTMHPFVSGRWAYVKAVEEFIRYAKGLPELWIATAEEVAQHCLKPEVRSQMKTGRLPEPEPVDFGDLSEPETPHIR